MGTGHDHSAVRIAKELGLALGSSQEGFSEEEMLGLIVEGEAGIR